jgi:hypothetical protein
MKNFQIDFYFLYSHLVPRIGLCNFTSILLGVSMAWCLAAQRTLSNRTGDHPVITVCLRMSLILSLCKVSCSKHCLLLLLTYLTYLVNGFMKWML